MSGEKLKKLSVLKELLKAILSLTIVKTLFLELEIHLR